MIEPLSRRALRVDEAAEALGVSRNKVYAMVTRGELPAIRMGVRGAIRIPVASLDKWIADNTTQPGSR